MPSIRTLYNDELIQAQRAAIAILHKLMTECDDPLEQRRIAVALVRTRQVDDGETTPPPAHSTRKSRTSTISTGTDARAVTGTASPAEEPARPATTDSATKPHDVNPERSTVNVASPSIDTSRDCTHPALPPYPGMHYRELMKRARDD